MVTNISQLQSQINNIVKDTITYASRFIGSKETTQNRGPTIDKIQAFYGKIGLPYCTIFVQYVYDYILMTKYKVPQLFTGDPSSQNLFSLAEKLGCTYQDKSKIKEGDIVIWRRFKLWKGHAGLIVKVDLENEVIHTIEGNTSGQKGTDWEGDGIWNKVRYIRKINFDVSAFWIRGFIDIRKFIVELYKIKKGVK